jgi:hypothetical protein
MFRRGDVRPPLRVIVFAGSSPLLKEGRVVDNASTTAGGITNGCSVGCPQARLTLTNGSVVTENRTNAVAPVGGGIRNLRTVVGATTSNVFGNTPDDCVNLGIGAIGCLS